MRTSDKAEKAMTNTEGTTATRSKSPSYPNYSLRKALQFAATVYDADRRNPIDRSVLAKHMGYTSLSGAADKSLSTMLQYGLVEKVAKGEVRMTQLAVDIMYPDKPADRAKALLQAAFSPTLFRDLKERFPDDRFSEDALRSYLMRQGFLDRAIGPVNSAYSDTVAFLQQEKAYESGSPSGTDTPSSGAPATEEKAVYGEAAVGDLVQWEADGVLRLETPTRVRAISEDGKWIFVEGSETGIPMEQTIVEQKAPATPVVPPTMPLQTAITTAVGEAEWMHNKVGPDTSVRLLVKGDIGPKEIGRLIKLLNAQKAVLEDDEEEGAA